MVVGAGCAEKRSIRRLFREVSAGNGANVDAFFTVGGKVSLPVQNRSVAPAALVKVFQGTRRSVRSVSRVRVRSASSIQTGLLGPKRVPRGPRGSAWGQSEFGLGKVSATVGCRRRCHQSKWSASDDSKIQKNFEHFRKI